MDNDDKERSSGLHIRVPKALVFTATVAVLTFIISYLFTNWFRNPADELAEHDSQIRLISKKLDRVDFEYIDSELSELREELDAAQYDIMTCQRNMTGVLADVKLHNSSSTMQFQNLDKQFAILDFQISQCNNVVRGKNKTNDF